MNETEKEKGQIEKSLYQSRDPEKRKRQLANLQQNLTPEQRAVLLKAQPERNISMADFDVQDNIEFIDTWLRIKLYSAQEVVLRAFYGLDMTDKTILIIKIKSNKA